MGISDSLAFQFNPDNIELRCNLVYTTSNMVWDFHEAKVPRAWCAGPLAKLADQPA
jgi:hypothetical protein